MDVASADSFFTQLDKLRLVYEECVKIYKETIPSTERSLNELALELEQKSQALDDVGLFAFAVFRFTLESLQSNFLVF